ncbi:MAG: hypothetical protein JXQ95_07085 [Alteromonas stellipolaris]|uniref:hypothetical protein n=1 Tax=Alteromonas stellipolaris TaxID=233316 RepID=UPI003B8B27A3
MEKNGKTQTFLHRRGLNNRTPPDASFYTVRIGISAAEQDKLRLGRATARFKNKAFIIAQKKAKAEQHPHYTKAIPSLEHECGYRIGSLSEIYSTLYASESTNLWERYCFLHEVTPRLEKEKKANKYNVVIGASHPITPTYFSPWKFLKSLFSSQ